MALGYKYGLRSDLRAPNLKEIFWGGMPPDTPSVCVLTHAPSSLPPQSQVPSAAPVKHSYMTRNACTKQQDKKKKAACVLLEQRSIEAYSNLFVALHSGLSNTFSFQLLFSKPRRETSNALNTLELHTLLRPT